MNINIGDIKPMEEIIAPPQALTEEQIQKVCDDFYRRNGWRLSVDKNLDKREVQYAENNNHSR
jgi:hypothetical protein